MGLCPTTVARAHYSFPRYAVRPNPGEVARAPRRAPLRSLASRRVRACLSSWSSWCG